MTEAEKIANNVLQEYLSNPQKFVLRAAAEKLIYKVAERTRQRGQEKVNRELSGVAITHPWMRIPNILEDRWEDEEV